MTEKTSTAGNAARGALRAKSFVLRNVFYWVGRVYVEALGREIIWARDKISVEENARAKGQRLTRCQHCGSLVKEDRA